MSLTQLAQKTSSVSVTLSGTINTPHHWYNMICYFHPAYRKPVLLAFCTCIPPALKDYLQTSNHNSATHTHLFHTELHYDICIVVGRLALFDDFFARPSAEAWSTGTWLVVTYVALLWVVCVFRVGAIAVVETIEDTVRIGRGYLFVTISLRYW